MVSTSELIVVSDYLLIFSAAKPRSRHRAYGAVRGNVVKKRLCVCVCVCVCVCACVWVEQASELSSESLNE